MLNKILFILIILFKSSQVSAVGASFGFSGPKPTTKPIELIADLSPRRPVQPDSINTKTSNDQITKPSKETTTDHNTSSEHIVLLQNSDINIDKGDSFIYSSDTDIDEIFIVNEKLAELKMINSKSFYIFGLNLGSTQIYINSTQSKQSTQMTLNVGYPVKPLKKTIDLLVPDNKVCVVPLQNGILLQGSVDSTTHADTIIQIAKQYIQGSETLINNMTITTSTQISLKVKIARVDRSSLNRFNLDWSGNVINKIDNKKISFQLNSKGSNNSPNSLQYTNGPYNILLALDMLEQESKATILAEPTLVTLSGQPASFLSGGEIPYSTTTTSVSQTTPTIEFKKYGISLAFTPTLIGRSIHMTLKSEVSSIDKSTGLTQNGTSIPGLATNTAETSVVLGDGQSLMIAGLSTNNLSNMGSRMPGLGNLPILSAFFDNEETDASSTELVIVVTPHIVAPMSAEQKPALPSDDFKIVSVFDAFFFGKRSPDQSPPPIVPGLQAGLSY